MSTDRRDRSGRTWQKPNGPCRRSHRLSADSQKKPAPSYVLWVTLLIALTAIVIITYQPVISAQAWCFDDDQYLTKNPLIRNPGWPSTLRFFKEVLEPSTVGGYYQPLTMVSLMLDYAWAGRDNDLRQFHRTSLALHCLNTVLVAVFLYLLFGQSVVAVLVALLFGLHPINVESVAWIAERKTLLAACFALVCLICYIVYARKSHAKFYVICLLMYLLALLSKPISIPLPLLLLLLDYWPLGRLHRRAIIEKIPFFVIGALSAAVTVISQARTAITVMPEMSSPLRIPLILCHNIVFYLYKICFPVNLSPHYPFPDPFSLSNTIILTGVLGTAALIVILLISLRWTRALLIGWLCFFLAILPTMGIIGFTNVIAADRFVYLPGLGLLLTLAWFGQRFCSRALPGRFSGWHGATLLIVLILAVSEALTTRHYLRYWQNSESLYRHMVAVTPHASVPHNSLGVALFDRGKLNEAIAQYKLALQLNPNYANAHNNLANALLEQGNFGEAMNQYNIALTLKPDWPEVRNNLGTLLGRQGKFDEAVAQYTEALRLEPDYLKAHKNLAAVLTYQNKIDQALSEYYHVLRLNSNDTNTLNTLAWIMATHENEKFHNPAEALHLAQRACKLTNYKDPTLLDTLAAAYARAGNFTDAVETAQRAVTLAQATGRQQLARQIQNRLQLYQKEQPHSQLAKPSDTTNP